MGHPTRIAADKSFKPNVLGILVVFGTGRSYTWYVVTEKASEVNVYVQAILVFRSNIESRGDIGIFNIGNWNSTVDEQSVYIVPMSADL